MHQDEPGSRVGAGDVASQALAAAAAGELPINQDNGELTAANPQNIPRLVLSPGWNHLKAGTLQELADQAAHGLLVFNQENRLQRHSYLFIRAKRP